MNRLALFALPVILIACGPDRADDADAVLVPPKAPFEVPWDLTPDVEPDVVADPCTPNETLPPVDEDDGGPDSGDPAFLITAPAGTIVVPQGGSVDVSVSVSRFAGFAENITVTLDGLPAGVTANELVVPSAETEGTITLSAPATVAVPKPDGARLRGHASSGSKSAAIKLMVRGPAGSLDRSFGNNGTAAALNDVFDIEEQLDRKLVFTGWEGYEATVCRLEPNGLPDTSFGSSDGCAFLDLGTWASGQALEIQEGAIVLAGSLGGVGIFIARLTAEGELDPTFGAGGWTAIELPAGASVSQLLVADDAIVVGGSMGLIRLNMDGSVDSTFSTILDEEGSVSGYPLAGFVMLGDRYVGVSGTQLRGFTAAGGTDFGFGNGGFVDLPLFGGAIAKTCQGELLVTGDGMSVARVRATGQIMATYPTLSGNDANGNSFSIYAQDIAVLADGTMVVSGQGSIDEAQSAVARRLPNGQRDEGFGFHGVAPAGYGDTGSDVEVLRDGRLMIASTRDQADGLLMRIWD